MMYDFFLYTGAKSAGGEKCGAEEIVLRLVEAVPKNENYRVFFDNYFTTLALLRHLRDVGILATGTLRSNRTMNCPLPTEKELKAKIKNRNYIKTKFVITVELY